MTEITLFNQTIIAQIHSVQEARIVQPVQVGTTDRENELVFFVKPELLEVQDETKIFNSLSLIKEKFQEFNVDVDGAVIIPGATLERYEIMNRHYGFINQLSRLASSSIDDETRAAMFAKLGMPDDGKYKILGGHEFLTHFQTDLSHLSKVWFAQTAQKLRSGFYFIEDTVNGEPILLVNGFHPSQLAHFTRANHRIYLMLLHTNTDWLDLKFKLVGDTFPERADSNSIRGMLAANPDHYGQTEVGINTNGVHLSAGPFEAAFEVVNFLGDLIQLDPIQTPPLAIKRAIEAGLPQEKALALLKNPKINDSDLFSETENMNTTEAAQFAFNAESHS
jgi:hypothetical protein